MSTPVNPSTSVILTAQRLRELPDARLVDARGGPGAQAAYAASHLAGAVHADLDRDLSGDASRPERGGRHPLPALADWATTLGRWGIGPDTTVVVYDDQGGANAAARVWWMLRAVGHQRVAILDGGLAAAERAGVPLSSEVPSIEDAGAYPVPPAWLLPTASRSEVASRRSDPEWVVLDVRAAERFEGRTEPFDPVAGHIPGAVNVPLTHNLDEAGGFRDERWLVVRYRKILGSRSPQRLIVHCGSGVTACHTLAALERAGLPGASLYVGSWSEWCRAGEPIATAGEAIEIMVNGEAQVVDSHTTIRALVERLGLGQGPVAVERNAEVVPRAEHDSTVLARGDVIEIVHFVGGG